MTHERNNPSKGPVLGLESAAGAYGILSDTQLNTRRHAGRGELAWRKSALLVTMVASVACGGNVDHSTAGNDGSSTGGMQAGADTAGDGGSSGGAGGSAATGGGGSAGSEAKGGATGEAGSVGAGGTGGAACPSPTPATAPLRRLTRFEYNNTVRDLLGDESSPAEALPADVLSLDAADDYVSTALVEGYHELAHDFALGIGEDAEALEALLGCSLVEEGEDACRERLFDGFLPRVFRRPLSSEDVADFEAVFERGQELGGDFASGVRAVLEVALQSPEFLYLLEFGEPAPELGDAWARLTPYELATRLSYLYWGSLPDAELLEAAATRELSTKEQVQAQATRLLADERAREVVHHFYDRLFGLQISPLAAKEQYPGFTEQVAELMLQETERFIDSVTWEAPGDFRTLLTASHSFSNEPLATFYGIEGVTGDEFRRVELDPARRAGILTQPSLWASMSFSLNTSPTRRGHFVVRKMLCMQVPPEPDGLPLPDLPPDLEPPPTTRERYAQHSQDPRCASCHSLMDPVGFAFGNYDAAGRWQDTENGITIDASGEIHGTDAAGTFVGAVELAERLAESDDAKRCYVQNWMEFAYRRGEAMEDTCTPSLLNDAFLSSEGSVRELLLALSQTEAFLYRPKSEVAP